jgi:hypothetical protein
VGDHPQLLRPFLGAQDDNAVKPQVAHQPIRQRLEDGIQRARFCQALKARFHHIQQLR